MLAEYWKYKENTSKSRFYEFVKNRRYACMLSCFSLVQLYVTPWTVALQVPPSMGFSRQKYWSGVPLPSLKESFIQAKLRTTIWETAS